MEDHKVLIAPVGDGIKSLYVALKELPIRKVHLIASETNVGLAEKTQDDLRRRGIIGNLWKIHGDIWEETFRVVSEIAQNEPNILIHVGTADRNTQCAATSAAFVNGVYAINGDEKEIGMLPVLKFNYYSILTEKKMAILNALREKSYNSLEDLSKKIRMSLPLLSYHIHGNPKSEGLVEMRLVSLAKRGATQAITLTPMGKLLLKGHVKTEAKK